MIRVNFADRRRSQEIMTESVESTSLTSASFEELARELLVRLGEDPTREGLVRTPNRVHRTMSFSPRDIRRIPKPC